MIALIFLPSLLYLTAAWLLRRSAPIGLAVLLGVLAILSGMIMQSAEIRSGELHFAFVVDPSVRWLTWSLLLMAIAQLLIGLPHGRIQNLYWNVAVALPVVSSGNAMTLAFALVAMDAFSFISESTKASALSLRALGALVLLGSQLELDLQDPTLLMALGLAIRQAGIWVCPGKTMSFVSTAVHLAAFARFGAASEILYLPAALAAITGALNLSFGANGQRNASGFTAAVVGIAVLTQSFLPMAAFLGLSFPLFTQHQNFNHRQRVYPLLYGGWFLFWMVLEGLHEPNAAAVLAFVVAGACLRWFFRASRREIVPATLPETGRVLGYELGLSLPLFLAGAITLQFRPQAVLLSLAWAGIALIATAGFHWLSRQPLSYSAEVPPVISQSLATTGGWLRSGMRRVGSILEGQAAFLWMILILLLGFLMVPR